MIPFVKTQDMYNCFIDDEMISVSVDHPRIGEVKQAIRDNDGQKIREIADLALAIKTGLENSTEEIAQDVTFENGVVMYKGKPVHTVLADRIMELRAEGLPVEPWCRFLAKLKKNKSFHSQNQLFTFLEKNNLPLAEDGDFYAYKGVTQDYKDCHTKTVDNSPGVSPPRMERSEVDDNINNACSHGYHAGSYKYATGFGERVVLIKINPEDAVCVPHDSVEKLRMCAYSVVRDCTHKMDKQLYTDNLDDYYDEDYDDEYDEYVDVNIVFDGDRINFDYKGENRTGWVADNNDPKIIRVELDVADPKFDTYSSNIRNFAKDIMENITYC